MSYLFVCAVALFVSGLTFFSGFGLGTMLMPAFALFFPIPIAVAATAIVHLANNIFKLVLIGRKAIWPVVLRFATPATITAMLGAALLVIFEKLPPIAHYNLQEQTYQVTTVRLVIGVIIIFFALFDLIPRLSNITFDKKYLPIGGALSGFFGGLSGNQGALRSAFLIKVGLDKDAFIATGVVSAVIVDIARLLVYGITFYSVRFAMISSEIWGFVLAATIAAFFGAYLGRQLLKKVTLRVVQIIVGVLLIVIGVGLAMGFL
jgi:uncharacterized membrane protein YfcA